MAARIFDQKTMERVVDPMLADLQREYAEAIRRGRVWRSRWILLTGHVVFLKTIAVCGGKTALRQWTIDDRSAMSRTLAVSLAATAAGTILLTVPPLLRALVRTSDRRRSETARLSSSAGSRARCACGTHIRYLPGIAWRARFTSIDRRGSGLRDPVFGGVPGHAAVDPSAGEPGISTVGLWTRQLAAVEKRERADARRAE